MFMTDCDLVYGRNTSTQSNSTAVIVPKADSESSEEKGTGMETAAKAAKAFVGAHVAAAKFAGGAVSKLSKKAADYAKSDDAAEKMDFVKNKAGSAFSGLKDKAAAFAAEHKKSSDKKISAANEYDMEANYDVSPNDTSYEYKTNTNVQPVPMSSSPVYNTGTYSYNENKKTPIIYILIGVISVLLVVLGVLFGMLLTKNKNENNNNSGTDAMYETPTETSSAPREITTTSLDSSSENGTQPQTEIASQQEAIPSEEQIMQAVQKAMYAHLDTEFNKEQTVDYYYFDRDAKYALYDINADGIDELFISYHNVESTGSDLYIYKNGEYIKSYDFYTGADICLSEQLLRENVYGGGEMTKIYVISDNEILQKDELKLLYGYGTTFYHNDFVISESEYNQLKSTYDSMNWIYVPDISRAFSEMVDMSAYSQNNTVSSNSYADIKQEIINSVDNEEYRGKNSHIENAPSDMVFYDYRNRFSISITNPVIYEGPDTNYSQISVYVNDVYIVGENNNWYYVQWYEGAGRFSHPCYGYLSKIGQNKKYTTYDTSAAGSDFSFNNDAYQRKIITENDPLNLRAAPSTSSEVIIQMPKDSDILLWGVNAEWAYVSYTENGITYYGYANREFIGVP